MTIMATEKKKDRRVHVISDRDRAIYLLRLLKNLKPLQTERHQEFLKRIKEDDRLKVGLVELDRMVKDDLEGMLGGSVEVVSPVEDAGECPKRPGYGGERIAGRRVGDRGFEATGDFVDVSYGAIKR